MPELPGFNVKNHLSPDRNFFGRKTLTVAKACIGGYVRHSLGDSAVGGIIVEAEAYTGYDDVGCHAFKGKTPRNSIMFGPPGYTYMYFTYGNHWMFNMVAEKEGTGCAVLVRAIEPVEGIEYMRSNRPKAKSDVDLTNGPGKLAAAMGLSKDHYGLSLSSSILTFWPPTHAYRNYLTRKHGEIITTTRIGLNEGAELPYRFVLGSHPNISVKPQP